MKPRADEGQRERTVKVDADRRVTRFTSQVSAGLKEICQLFDANENCKSLVKFYRAQRSQFCRERLGVL